MEVEELTIQATLEAAGGTGKTGTKVAGLAYAGGPIRISGFPHPVVVDLRGLKVSAGKIPLASDHSSALGARVGWCEAKVVNGRIMFAGEVVGDTGEAKHARALAKSGGLSVSIGTSIEKLEHVQRGETVEVNGRTIPGPVDVVRKGELREISAVGIGADPEAVGVAAMKTKARTTMAESGSEAVEAVQADPTIKAERERCMEIQAAFRNIPNGIERAYKLIESGSTAAEARAEALGEMQARYKPVSFTARRDPDVSQFDVGVSAYLHLAGRADLAAELGDEAATTGETLVNRAGRSWRLTDELVANYGGVTVEAGYSNDAIAAETIRRVALDTFRKSPEAWRSFAHRVPLSDFRENKLARLAGTFNYEKVGPGGNLKHGTLAQETTSIKLNTAGVMIGITRQAIINDDVQLLADVPAEMAAEAARSVGDDLFTLLNANDFWTTGTNQIEGAGSVLGIDSYGDAVALLRNQADTSGRKLNLSPRWLVVPPALEAKGRQLLTSMEVGRTDGEPTSNPWKGSAELLIDARLPATEWILFSDARNAAAVVGTLNGMDSPTVETAEAEFSTLGRQHRSYYDYGCALHETRAAIRSLGQ